MRLKSPAVLRALMHQSGLSTRRLAKAAQLSHHSAIDHLLSGRRDTCPDLSAARIASALGAPPGLLFEPDQTDTESAAS